MRLPSPPLATAGAAVLWWGLEQPPLPAWLQTESKVTKLLRAKTLHWITSSVQDELLAASSGLQQVQSSIEQEAGRGRAQVQAAGAPGAGSGEGEVAQGGVLDCCCRPSGCMGNGVRGAKMPASSGAERLLSSVTLQGVSPA